MDSFLNQPHSGCIVFQSIGFDELREINSASIPVLLSRKIVRVYRKAYFWVQVIIFGNQPFLAHPVQVVAGILDTFVIHPAGLPNGQSHLFADDRQPVTNGFPAVY